MRMSFAVLELQPRPRAVARLHRLRSKTVLDVAAEGLHIEFRVRRTGELQVDVAADRLAVNLPLGHQSQRGGQVARYTFKSTTSHVGEFNPRAAAHAGDVHLAAAARQMDVAADSLDLDGLGGPCRQLHLAADRGRADVAADLAAHTTAHRLQL